MPNSEVTLAQANDKSAAINTLVLAFSSDPMMRWIYPDADSYLAQAPLLYNALAGQSVLAGCADVTPGLAGVAMWMAPGVKPDEALMGPVTAGIRPEIMSDLLALLAECDVCLPKDENLWFLPLVGVDPGQRGKGLGSALMQHAVNRFDALGVPAYLESSNSLNVSLYLRYGFEVLTELQVGSSPVLRPMLRKPR